MQFEFSYLSDRVVTGYVTFVTVECLLPEYVIVLFQDKNGLATWPECTTKKLLDVSSFLTSLDHQHSKL